MPVGKPRGGTLFFPVPVRAKSHIRPETRIIPPGGKLKPAAACGGIPGRHRGTGPVKHFLRLFFAHPHDRQQVQNGPGLPHIGAHIDQRPRLQGKKRRFPQHRVGKLRRGFAGHPKPRQHYQQQEGGSLPPASSPASGSSGTPLHRRRPPFPFFHFPFPHLLFLHSLNFHQPGRVPGFYGNLIRGLRPFGFNSQGFPGDKRAETVPGFL